MEDQQVDVSDHAEAGSDKTANQGTRAGAQPKGGVAPQPGDPTNPRQAAARSAAIDEKTADMSFGGHKGEESGFDRSGKS